jgi:hypothetical protein
VLAALLSLAMRYQVEAGSRRVGLVLDYTQLRTLAAATGIPVGEALSQFKAAGITGVAVTEETLGELESEGVVTVQAVPVPNGQEYRLAFSNAHVGARAADYLSHLVRGATETAPKGDRVALPGPGGGTIYLPGRFGDLNSTPTGVDPDTLQQIRQAGLKPIARVLNPLGLDSPSLRWELAGLQEQGVDTIIFAGDEVLGFSGLVKETAQAFRDFGFYYGSVEFGKQRGDQGMSELLKDRLIRVHSISSGEMARLTPKEAIERYVRAAAERNIRLNYVRLPETVTPSTFADNVAYVQELSRDTAKAGFGLKDSSAFKRVWPDSLVGRLPVALIALGIGAGALLLLAALVPLSKPRQAVGALLAGLFCALLVLSGKSIGLQLVALLAAVVFPSLAFVLFLQPVGAFEDHPFATVRTRSRALAPAVAEFGAMSAVTLIGALMVAGTLSELPFMIKTSSFAGIKAATVIPLLLVGLVYLTGMSGEYPTWQVERDAVAERLRAFFSEPLRVWHTIALLGGLILIALVVARSGNDSGLGASDVELRFRALLDRYLGARPRTKEFMLGHPALLLGLGLATSARWRRWALPLLLLGIIGQVGMLNSFCHLHTPLKLTVLRTIHGLWMGGLIGCLLLALWRGMQGNRRRPGERQRV